MLVEIFKKNEGGGSACIHPAAALYPGEKNKRRRSNILERVRLGLIEKKEKRASAKLAAREGGPGFDTKVELTETTLVVRNKFRKGVNTQAHKKKVREGQWGRRNSHLE